MNILPSSSGQSVYGPEAVGYTGKR